jgi:hypothetical protein
MMKRTIIIVTLILVSFSQLFSQSDLKLKPEMLSMRREKMTFLDDQVLLFNSRGYASPCQYSATGITYPRFFPIDIPSYNFYFNFLDTLTGLEIRDDVHLIYKNHEYDPLACNFRPGAPMVMVTQDEVWQPNLYTRTSTFHKEINNEWITFSLKTWTSVSGEKDEIFLKIRIHNRNKKALSLTLAPHQSADALRLQDPRQPKKTGSAKITTPDTFTIESEQLRFRISSSIEKRNKKGFVVTIPAGGTSEYYFVIQMEDVEKMPLGSALYQPDIPERMARADQKVRKTLKWAGDRLPAFQSDNKILQEYYIRTIYTVLTCRFERENFLLNPFWTVGFWPSCITWDNSYSSDLLGILDPVSLKEAILLSFREGKMKSSWITFAGPIKGGLYIQEPFAVQVMIDAYLRQTGDYSLLNNMAGDVTVYEWLKRWSVELHDKYGQKNGLINVGYNTELIIEIRTDGYNHIVPIVNCLTLKFYQRLIEFAGRMNDTKGKETYTAWAKLLEKSINENLWNEEAGWYDNLYPDGTKGTVWTYHLFDLLNSTAATPYQQQRMVSHLRENEFLGKFGLYSIARTDSVHWDRIDADWGGGGQYAGMPGRISRNLFEIGFPVIGMDILKRVSQYINYFPHLPQNPRTDNPYADVTSMSNEIAAGAGFEAIVFGMLGVKEQENGTIEFNPNYFSEVGNCRLTGLKFRENSYDLIINDKDYSVYKNGKLISQKFYGVKTLINP